MPNQVPVNQWWQGFLSGPDDLLTLIWCGVLALAAIILFVQWLCWIFGCGRFKMSNRLRKAQQSQTVRYLISNFLVNIINDFRHLLALALMFVFVITLVLAMWPGLQSGDGSQVFDGIKTVAAAMGGLIGSIVGYYFGERAGRNREETEEAGDSSEAEQGEQNGDKVGGGKKVQKVDRPAGLDDLAPEDDE